MRLRQLLRDRKPMELFCGDVLLSSSVAQSPLPFSICCLEKAVPVPQLCPRGALNGGIPFLSVLRGPHFILRIWVRHGCVS